MGPCPDMWGDKSFVRELPSPPCKCKILKTKAAKTKGWQLILENVQCEVASEMLGLFSFSGEDECTFQLGS